MDNINKVIDGYRLLLEELEESGATEKWQVNRRIINTLLRLNIAQRDHQDARAKHGAEPSVPEEERAAIKRAIELRRQIYRRRKEMIKQGL